LQKVWSCPNCGYHKFIHFDDNGVLSYQCLACGEFDLPNPTNCFLPMQCRYCSSSVVPVTMPLNGTAVPVRVSYCPSCTQPLKVHPLVVS